MDKVSKVVTLDVETTLKSDVGHRASPFHPNNRIVACQLDTVTSDGEFFEAVFYGNEVTIGFEADLLNDSRLIGQNVKFDIHYLRRLLPHFDTSTCTVWDTQLAEYLLTGQQVKFADLDTLALKYGGTLKDDRIKALWESGVETEEIDKDMLLDYLDGDVKNTGLVAGKQMEKAEELGMLPFIETQMDALLAVEEMEFNGMNVNHKVLDRLDTMLTNLATTSKETAEHGIIAWYMDERGVDISDVPFDITSPKQLSALLFGGTLSWKAKEPMLDDDGKPVVFKSGKRKGEPREKTVAREIYLSGIYSPKEEWKTKQGNFSTSDSVLAELAKKSGYSTTPRAIQRFRKYEKERTTYIEGIKALVYPDGKLHGQLQQTATNTGRLSSSKPNMQNMPSSGDSEIKKMFTSRWGSDGFIIEADYKQLEVICLAVVSGEPRLMHDLLIGKDMHNETGKAVFGSSMSKDERRIVKTINFGLIYGGGAGTLSKQAGVSKELAQQCIDAFYKRYPGVKKWQKEFFEQVKQGRTYGGRYTKKGFPMGESTVTTPSGRRFHFTEYDNPEWMTWATSKTGFSPQEASNYPVQGFATGDIVPMMLGILFRTLKQDKVLRSKCLMINTVHDSIIFDCHSSVIDHAVKVIKNTLEDAPMYVKEILGVDFGLPLKVDITYGKSWKEQDFSADMVLE